MSVDERTVARGRCVDPDRNLACAAADFYLLETLANVRHDQWAKTRLAEHEDELAAEFAQYLDLAIGGELRYARQYVEADELPPELAPYFAEVRSIERGKAWLVWSIIRRKLGERALELAQDMFLGGDWRRGFGGEAWWHITRTLLAHLQGAIPRRVFVDQCFDLEHNNGCVFNKLYDCTGLLPILCAHGNDQYSTLLAACSPETRRRWSLHERRLRAEHDPVWLGVQSLDVVDPFEDVA
jgi:hypothetical protein